MMFTSVWVLKFYTFYFIYLLPSCIFLTTKFYISKNSLKCFKDQKESHKLKSLNLQIVQNFVPSWKPQNSVRNSGLERSNGHPSNDRGPLTEVSDIASTSPLNFWCSEKLQRLETSLRKINLTMNEKNYVSIVFKIN